MQRLFQLEAPYNFADVLVPTGILGLTEPEAFVTVSEVRRLLTRLIVHVGALTDNTLHT